jgi:hypothetical protein
MRWNHPYCLFIVVSTIVDSTRGVPGTGGKATSGPAWNRDTARRKSARPACTGRALPSIRPGKVAAIVHKGFHTLSNAGSRNFCHAHHKAQAGVL